MDISFREASLEDSELVAKCVLAAVDLYDFKAECMQLKHTTQICMREDTLYSFRHALIVSVDGADAGCIISYPGEKYGQMRKQTFSLIAQHNPEINPEETGQETFPGEYYLDTMALMPQFRGLGLGVNILSRAIERGARLGYSKFSLIVAHTHPKLHTMYTRVGFRDHSELVFFGEMYTRMILER